MANVLIRHLPEKTLKQAKELAKAHRRSVQEELRTILVEALGWQSPEWIQTSDLLRDKVSKFSARHSDSTKLIRQDRNR
jgi:plasmid stability protein